MTKNKLSPVVGDYLVPDIETDTFLNNPDMQFATVDLGYGLYPTNIDDNLFRAYLRLRKNVYGDERGILPLLNMQEDGTEIDADDHRSRHIAILENRGQCRAALVSCIRMIRKDDQLPLPIENMFQEGFTQPAPMDSVEISRLIARTTKRGHRRLAVAKLFDASLAYIDRNNLSPVYGVVEDDLEKSLHHLGAPHIRIAEPRMVEKYDTVNTGVRIDIDSMKDRLGKESLRSAYLNLGEVSFWGRYKPISNVSDQVA